MDFLAPVQINAHMRIILTLVEKWSLSHVCVMIWREENTKPKTKYMWAK